MRIRPNLTITPHAQVDRVLLAGNRAAGVVDAAGTPYRAGQVILSVGAFGSPAILIRSGIGPAAHLRDLAIPVRADLPVGEGLQDHPFSCGRMIEGVHIARRIGRDAAFQTVAEAEMLPGPAVTDDAALRQAITEQLDVYHHATSTAAMGPDGDGVVDALGRVYGTEALMVADASIMPLAPSAPTNLTTMMITEHIARRAFAPADPHTALHPSRLSVVVQVQAWLGQPSLDRTPTAGPRSSASTSPPPTCWRCVAGVLPRHSCPRPVRRGPGGLQR